MFYNIGLRCDRCSVTQDEIELLDRDKHSSLVSPSIIDEEICFLTLISYQKHDCSTRGGSGNTHKC